MPRTAGSVRTNAAPGLAELERRKPEWRTWLRLLSEVARAQVDPRWQTSLPDAATPGPEAGSGVRAPLLHRRRMTIDGGGARQLLRRLASAAADSLGRYRPSTEAAVELIAAAVRQDSAEIGALAASAGVDGAALGSIAHLATLPLLHACGRLLESRLPSFWPEGYCPVCAAWPILAERRGLDRSRQFRCGRCAVQWQMQGLCCVYCGERDHRRLGSLVPEDGDGMLNVEICHTCGGYLKSVATLQRIPPIELLIRDLDTVELDLVAVDRGYGRPEGAGFPLEILLG
jgi:FdhE protein